MMQSSSAKKPRSFYGWYIIAASWILVFLYSSMAVNVFFKPMLEEFGWDRATLASVQAVSMIFFTIASPFLGHLVDRFGPKVMIITCEISQILSGLINAVASNIGHLYVSRIFYGLNAIPVTQVLINHWFVKRRGLALGILATGIPIGTMLLVPFSQYLILQWGWRTVMLFWSAVTFIVAIPLVLMMKNNPEEKGTGPDGRPPEAITQIDISPQSSETKPVAKPGSNLAEAARTSSFWFLSITQLICGIGCGFMMTHNIIFATDMGFSDMAAASLASLQGGLNLAGVLIMGYVSDRIARKNALSLTHFIRSMAFVSIAVFIMLGGLREQPWLLYVGVGLFGFGWFTTVPLVSALVADLFGSMRMGTILGIVFSCHILGMATGSYFGGVIFEQTGSYLTFFIIQGVLELIAVAFAFFIKRKALFQDMQVTTR
jgi:MFS family permease